MRPALSDWPGVGSRWDCDVSQSAPPLAHWLETQRTRCLLTVAALYAFVSFAGYQFAVPPGIVTAVLPSAGLAFTAVLLLGIGIWPAIWIGALAVNVYTLIRHAGLVDLATILIVSSVVAAANSIQAVAGGVSYLRVSRCLHPYASLRCVIIFLSTAGALASVISALLGPLALAAAGYLPWHSFGGSALTWWLGNVAGVILVGPLLLSYLLPVRGGWNWGEAAATTLFSAFLVLLTHLIFGGWYGLRLPLSYMILPLLLWAAYNFGPRGTAVATLLVSTIALWGTVHGLGPFGVVDNPARSLLLLQAFIIVCSATGLIFSGVLQDQRRAETALREARDALERKVEERTQNLTQINRELDQRQRQLSTAQAIAHVGSWEEDLVTGDVIWSAETFRIFGWDPSAAPLRQEAALGWIPEDERAAVQRAMQEAREEKRPYSFDHRLVRPDGEQRQVSQEGEIEFDDQGRAVWRHGTIQDITERKMLEEQLQHSQKMEAIGRLAGSIAHDFNNLLTVIVGYSSLLQVSLDPHDDLQATVAEIQRAGERATALTGQLLAFSRRQATETRILDLNQVVDGMRAMIQRLIGEDVEFATRLDQEAATVRADPSQLEQVLMNLVINARDAMPGGGRLRVETHVDRWRSGAPFVELTVSDTGQGMNQQTRARIFEPFFTTKEQGKGTGLGLATVFSIVERAGGHIHVESTVGRGTTMRVRLPLVRGAAVDEPQPPPAPKASGRGTILVVEDEAGVRRLIVEILAGAGYQVLEAVDGLAALEICRKPDAKIDLVISDVVMPRMSGPEMAEVLGVERPGWTVLFISGYPDGVLKPIAPDTQGRAFLHKPFTPNALLERVSELLKSTP